MKRAAYSVDFGMAARRQEGVMFRDRAAAAHELAGALREFELDHPLILAIPRGGVVTGAVLAQELGGDLDVVLSRKLRAPGQPELAMGAVSEDGQMHLNRSVARALDITEAELLGEKEHQLSEIARRKQLFRSVRPKAPISGRTVIVTDDGIATGSTMMAALLTVRPQGPKQLIVAVPVAPIDRLAAFRERCDKIVCLESPEDFWAVGQFYEEFPAVEDQEVLAILKQFSPSAEPDAAGTRGRHCSAKTTAN
jgi:predicted phosphoribosyltransferase